MQYEKTKVKKIIGCHGLKLSWKTDHMQLELTDELSFNTSDMTVEDAYRINDMIDNYRNEHRLRLEFNLSSVEPKAGRILFYGDTNSAYIKVYNQYFSNTIKISSSDLITILSNIASACEE